jgi:GT2 family glycosyltransferase
MNNTFVIIVTYNAIEWTQECLDALLQSSLKVSIIVVDNCSTDHTVSFIKDTYNKDDVFIIEMIENLGFGKANNVGLKHALKANADYIFLLNQDAFVEPNTIETLVKLANKNPEYGVLSPIHTNGNGTMLDKSFLYYINKFSGSKFVSDFVLNKTKQTLYSVPMINAAAWLLPKSTIEVVGGFDPMFFLYGEDDNYCQRVNYFKLKIGIASNVFIRHDSPNNNTVEATVGSEKYYTIFLNRIKVVYGNVNYEKYKEISALRFYFLKRSIISIMRLNFLDFKVNRTKRELLKNLDIKKSVLLNRQKGIKYL